jgi:hypothetical protein
LSNLPDVLLSLLPPSENRGPAHDDSSSTLGYLTAQRGDPREHSLEVAMDWVSLARIGQSLINTIGYLILLVGLLAIVVFMLSRLDFRRQ